MRTDRYLAGAIATIATIVAIAAIAVAPPVAATEAGSELETRIRRAAAEATAGSGDDRIWIRYTVDRVAGRHGDRHCRSVLRFDDERAGGYVELGSDDRPWPASRALAIFVGWRDGAARALRSATTDCLPDAPGAEIHDLGTVDVAASARYLDGWVDRSDGAPGAPSRDEALAALALHDAPEVDAALERRARRAGDPLQEEAVFWLGAARGAAGMAALGRLLDSGEAPPDLREHVAFALTLPDLPGAADRLVALARRDPDSGVREQALFWLAQEAGERAVAELVRAVDDDPDRGVKEAAVFSISQLPEKESVPLLIRLAGSHADPHVRKQAFFWLGQSGAPEALAFFERVLAASGQAPSGG